MIEAPYINIQNVHDWAYENKPIENDVPIIPPWNNAIYTYQDDDYSVFVDIKLIEVDKSVIELLGSVPAWESNITQASYIIEGKVNIFHKPTATYYLSLDQSGVMINTYHVALDDRFEDHDDEIKGIIKGEVDRVILFVNIANAFAHCKNVEIIDEPLTRQQRRRKERKGETFYKVLAIEPFKKQVRNECRESGESEMKQAMHICRGHFATYSEDKPLFGKYTGTFWKPQHVKGNSQAGIVIKDYEINQPSKSV